MIRIGQGFDVHAFADDKKLFLGGLLIPHVQGLEGHSDADVVIHALIDAILGALALGDIGTHFPPTDPIYKDCDSAILLSKVNQLMIDRKYKINNIDLTIIAQKPFLKPFITPMVSRLATILSINHTAISIKATTTEKLGFIGRKEGIAVLCVVLLNKNNHE